MLSTAQSLYVAFLDGIKKSYTGTVIPAVFDRIWNQWAQVEWLKNNVSSDEGIELTEKQIDDLAVLVNRWHFNTSVPASNVYALPTGESLHSVVYGGITELIKLPKYYRALSIRFKLDYDSSSNQECSLTGVSGWLKATHMNSDQRSMHYSSVYRKPKDSNLYWQRIQVPTLATVTTPAPTHKEITAITDSIEMLTDEVVGSTSNAMYLEYLTYPVEISVSSTPNINSNLSEDAKKEIVDIAVRMYLERVRDPRYQSFLIEQKMNSSNKL